MKDVFLVYCSGCRTNLGTATLNMLQPKIYVELLCENCFKKNHLQTTIPSNDATVPTPLTDEDLDMMILDKKLKTLFV